MICDRLCTSDEVNLIREGWWEDLWLGALGFLFVKLNTKCPLDIGVVNIFGHGSNRGVGCNCIWVTKLDIIRILIDIEIP